MLKRRGPRRVIGAALVVAGGLLMWLSPEHPAGIALFAAGIALEIAGLTLERRKPPS